jgi:hypothetical protein
MQILGVSHTLKKWPTVERKRMDTRRFSFFLLSRPLKKAFGGKKKLPRLAIFRVRAGDGGIVMLLQMAAKSDESSD